MNDELEERLYQYRLFLPIYLTIQVTTLVLTLLQLPTTITFYRELGYQSVDPWLGLWFVLLILGLSVAIILGLLSPWRKMPFARRMNLIFGYLGAAWTGLISLGFHFVFHPAYFYFTAAAGLVWWISFMVLRKNKRSQEIFP